MKTFDFKNRLFLAYALVTVGIVLLFGILLIGITASQNRETELMHQQEVFEGNLWQIESLLTQANRLASQVATSNEVLSLFIALDEPDNTAGGGENYFNDQLMDKIRIDSLLAGFNGVDGFADRISVFNRTGDYVSTGRLYETEPLIEQTLKSIDWIDNLLKAVQSQPERFWVSGFHGDLWSDNPSASLLSLYRPLSYTDLSAPYGLVSVQLRADRLTSLDFWADEMNTEYLMIDDGLSSAAAIVYPRATPFSFEALYTLVADELPAAPSESKRTLCIDYAQDGVEYKLLAARLSYSNWILLRALPIDQLTLPYRSNYAIMILSCLALMLLFLIIVNYMAERISRPLRELSSSIGGVNLQNMRLNTGESPHTYSTRELIALDEAFRSMLKRLDDSIALEMQAYMRVLQSQMNPHFLYNMLSVIIASSESAGDEKTVSMCLKLTAMLRYVADFSRDSVPLIDELEHTRNYLELMKERYEDLFTFEIELNERAAHILLPKLTIQPLAENCFVHGFTNEPPWHVHVEIHVDGNRWRLSVEDNGVGMTQEEIRSLLSRMESYKENMADKYQELTLGGMGLINTLLRLSLLSGQTVSYAIDNRPGGGLRVEIGGTIDDSRIDR